MQALSAHATWRSTLISNGRQDMVWLALATIECANERRAAWVHKGALYDMASVAQVSGVTLPAALQAGVASALAAWESLDLQGIAAQVAAAVSAGRLRALDPGSYRLCAPYAPGRISRRPPTITSTPAKWAPSWPSAAKAPPMSS